MATLELRLPHRDAASSQATLPMTGIAKVALVLTYLTSATTPWNGWRFGGVRPGDLFLLLALLVFFASDLGHVWPRLPGWVWQFGAIILLVTFAHEFFPTDPNYLSRRLVVGLNNAIVRGNVEVESNLTVGLKFVVPIIGLPLMYAFAYQHDRRALFRSAYAFAVGAAISALIGFSDVRGVTHLSKSLTGIPAVAGRAPGLTLHPNFLATTCVLGLPFMLAQIRSPRLRSRVVASILLALLLLGIYASGSRGGAAVGAGTMLLSFAVMPRYRQILPTVALLTAGAASLAFALKPSLGHSLLHAMRLAGDTGTTGSNTARGFVGHQGVLDFLHSPIDGVGMQVAAEAHNVYLQALAAGGLLLCAGYVIFVASAVVKSVRLMGVMPLAHPFFVAAVAGALLSTVENALTDRLAYVPLALIAAMPGRPAEAPPPSPVSSSTAEP